MLKVNIHAGPLRAISSFNNVGWVEIAYERLDSVADYKTMLYQKGIGAQLQTSIYKYPRWSASLWDLTARAIALGLRDDLDCLDEELPTLATTGKRFAFASQICAVIEHTPPAGEQHRRILGTASISQHGRKRGTYVASFEEHTAMTRTTLPFDFRPACLRPAELLMYACLQHLTSSDKLPPRPGLCIPQAVMVDNEKYVSIQSLVEPAKTGFEKWLFTVGKPPIPQPGAALGVAKEALYVQFLREAVLAR